MECGGSLQGQQEYGPSIFGKGIPLRVLCSHLVIRAAGLKHQGNTSARVSVKGVQIVFVGFGNQRVAGR